MGQAAVSSPLAALGEQMDLRQANRETLAAAKTLTVEDHQFQILDPGGAHRDVTLPAERAGLLFVISNIADGVENLVVKNDAAATLATLNQNDAGLFYSDGTGWVSLVGEAATDQT